MTLHKHRIIPGHMGGTYDPSNVVHLTIEQHAEAHRILFEEHGCWQDELAWKGLSGQMGKEELTRAAHLAGNLGKKHTLETRKKMSISRKGKPINRIVTPELRKALSEYNKKNQPIRYGRPVSEETRQKMRLSHLGKKHSEEHRKKISDAMKAVRVS